MPDRGLVSVRSRFSVKETVDRLVVAAEQARLVVFARIDHARGARDAGFDLRPTELLIFGHPRGGTPLMLDRQTAGIDLPVKALAWQDAGGQVWLTYNRAAWIGERHGLSEQSQEAVTAIEDGVAALVAAVTSGPEGT